MLVRAVVSESGTMRRSWDRPFSPTAMTFIVLFSSLSRALMVRRPRATAEGRLHKDPCPTRWPRRRCGPRGPPCPRAPRAASPARRGPRSRRRTASRRPGGSGRPELRRRDHLHRRRDLPDVFGRGDAHRDLLLGGHGPAGGRLGGPRRQRSCGAESHGYFCRRAGAASQYPGSYRLVEL